MKKACLDMDTFSLEWRNLVVNTLFRLHCAQINEIDCGIYEVSWLSENDLAIRDFLKILSLSDGGEVEYID